MCTDVSEALTGAASNKSNFGTETGEMYAASLDVCLSVHHCISIEKKTNWMLLNALLHL